MREYILVKKKYELITGQGMKFMGNEIEFEEHHL
jgi:hypothetical protein